MRTRRRRGYGRRPRGAAYAPGDRHAGRARLTATGRRPTGPPPPRTAGRPGAAPDRRRAAARRRRPALAARASRRSAATCDRGRRRRSRAGTSRGATAPTPAGADRGGHRRVHRPPRARPAPASGFATPGPAHVPGQPDAAATTARARSPTAPRCCGATRAQSGGMCAESSVGSETKRVVRHAAGPASPSVFERDGRTWVVFGAYDRAVHFVDYDTGEDILPPFPTGDIIKGSVTHRPRRLPARLLGQPRQLAARHRHRPARARPSCGRSPPTRSRPTMWNDDWDGSPLVIDDYLFEGGENSQFHIVKLNRATAPTALVRSTPSWCSTPRAGTTSCSAAQHGDRDVSIENSVAYHDGVVYFANSGGLVQGWDISGLAEGAPADPGLPLLDRRRHRRLDRHRRRGLPLRRRRVRAGQRRGAEVGQLIKLDPRKPDNPLVWSVERDPRRASGPRRPSTRTS